MRTRFLPLGLLLCALPAAAQTPPQPRDPDMKAAGGGAPLPEGWQMRLDRANANAADAKFVSMGSGFHATTGPAAIFWNPAHTAQGEYTARAAFTQTKASRHAEAYGLFVGGKDLGGENQDYLYFVIRQDGKFLVKHRAGDDTHTIIDWTEHPAVRKLDEAGKAANELSIVVGAKTLQFKANGVELVNLPRPSGPGHASFEGIVGLRVNHNLDVHIAGFAIEPAAPAAPAPSGR